MADELDYTINAPEEVECPFCRQKMNMTETIRTMDDDSFNGRCDHCHRIVHYDLEYDITVLAWKPEMVR